MNPEIIAPDVQCSMVCEDVRNEISGQQTLVGVISVVPAPTAPVAFFRLCVWTRWCNGNGAFTQKTLLLHPENEDEIASAEVRFQVNGLDSHATNVNVFGGLQLPVFGTYHVEIHLDGELRLRYPVAVVPVRQSS